MHSSSPVFKWHIVVFKLNTLLTWNIILLVVGPILLALLVFTERFFLHQRRIHDHTAHNGDNSERPLATSGNAGEGTAQAQQPSHPHFRYFSRLSTSSVPRVGAGGPATESNGDTAPPPVHVNHDLAAANGHAQRHWALEYTDNVWNHVKFWFSLAVVAGLLAGLTSAYVSINPFVRVSSLQKKVFVAHRSLIPMI